MKGLLTLPLLLVLIVSVPLAFAQEYSDNTSTRYVVIGHDNNGNGPTMYKDSEGYSVVNGIVFNNGDNSVSNVVIQINFFDDFDSNPIEVVSGNTTLEVIPSNGQSSFTIRSPSPNPNISEVVVNVIGFDESVPESISEYTDNTPLSITTNKSNYQTGDTIVITGKIENKIVGMPVILQIFRGGEEGATDNSALTFFARANNGLISALSLSGDDNNQRFQMLCSGTSQFRIQPVFDRMGYFVTPQVTDFSLNLGTAGSIEMPKIANGSPSLTDLNQAFGAFDGAFGYESVDERLYVRESSTRWVFFNADGAVT